MIYLYGVGSRYKIVKFLLKENNINQKIISIDKKKNIKKKIYNEEYLIKKFNIKRDYLILTISDPVIKNKIINRILNKIKIRFYKPLISKSALLKKNVKIGDGSIIMDRAYIGSNVTIGKNCSIGNLSLISHDTKVGSFTEISHKVKIAGNVKIGKKSFVGLGTTIIQNKIIGNNVFIGAGVLIKKNVDSDEKITLKQTIKKSKR